MMQPSVDEQAAAMAVISLKRSVESAQGCPEAVTDLSERERAGKTIKRRVTDSPSSSDRDKGSSVCSAGSSPSCESSTSSNRPLLVAPFYYYRDHSQDKDDSLTPLTPLSRAPNFPVKMHAILSRSDFQDIITWLPHGRSWRIIDSKKFESRVLPEYFEHRKFSSFIRIVNAWGFRRMMTGCDRNTYYHELFLRGLPFLCKKMQRPGIAKKVAGDPNHEPNFYEISNLHPLPEIPLDNNASLLPCTSIDDAKAGVPIHQGHVNQELETPTSTENKKTTPVVSTETGTLPETSSTPKETCTVSTEIGNPLSPTSLPQCRSVVQPDVPALPLTNPPAPLPASPPTASLLIQKTHPLSAVAGVQQAVRRAAAMQKVCEAAVAMQKAREAALVAVSLALQPQAPTIPRTVPQDTASLAAGLAAAAAALDNAKSLQQAFAAPVGTGTLTREPANPLIYLARQLGLELR